MHKMEKPKQWWDKQLKQPDHCKWVVEIYTCLGCGNSVWSSVLSVHPGSSGRRDVLISLSLSWQKCSRDRHEYDWSYISWFQLTTTADNSNLLIFLWRHSSYMKESYQVWACMVIMATYMWQGYILKSSVQLKLKKKPTDISSSSFSPSFLRAGLSRGLRRLLSQKIHSS